MTIVFDLPPEIEDALRREGQDPSRALKEAGLVDLYRRGIINHHELATALGLGRIETDAVLKRHDVPLNMSIEDVLSDLRELRRDRTQ